jgi:diguanylate cyclase (GGDEF)-like protein
MCWVLTPGTGILFGTTALSLVLAGVAWGRGPRGGRCILTLLMVAVAQWCLVAALEAGSVSLSWKIVWSKLEYIGNGATATLFLLFAAQHTGRVHWFRHGVRRSAVWLLPAAGFGLAMTNELHHWVWTGFSSGPPESNAVVYHHGIGFFLIVAWIYAYILLAIAMLAVSARRSSESLRREARTLLLAALFPAVAGVLYSLGSWPVPGLNLVPLSCFVTAVVFLISLGFLRMFDLVPIARSALVQQMTDAVIVMASDGRIVDTNLTASQWFGPASLVGRHAGKAFAPWPELQRLTESGSSHPAELTLRDTPLLHVDVRVAPLHEALGRPAGHLVVMRDISERFRASRALEQANQRLGSQITQIETLQTELKEQTIRDSLTGLFNRRYLDEVLPRELSRASHEGGILSVVMVDIDHFKETNDRRGHREGDRLLSLLGMLLRERSRPSDVACRYGGEEFLLILPGAPPAIACARMEEIRAEYAVRLRAAGFAQPPTLSAGVAAFPEHAQSDDDLLHAADAALYAAKSAGRNRVCVAGTTRG